MDGQDYLERNAATMSDAQPAIRETPPMGAIAPKIPMPLRARMYRLPLNSRVPPMKRTADTVRTRVCQRMERMPTARSASA